MTLPLVTAHRLQVQFGHKVVLSGVDLIVKPKEIVTLIGPNGAGKSTLVKVVLGLIRPNQGEVTLKPGLRIGYMPQRLAVDPLMPLSVNRFLQLAGSFVPGDFQRVLHQLRIEHLQTASLQSISGGELQRVLLARALLREPDLLVLDEPVQGVDVTGQEELYQLITSIRESQGCGILMVSHDLHLVMAGTDTVLCLNKHVCCSGHPNLVSQHPEFLSLFGQQKLAGLVVYAHQHNHQHDLGGEVCS